MPNQREPRTTGLFVALAGSALVCLYLGFYLYSTAPPDSEGAVTLRWYAVHNASHLALKIGGGVLVLAAAFSLSGRRIAALFASLALGLFSLLMLGNGVLFAVQDYVMGSFDIFAVVMFILASIGAYESVQAYRIYSPQSAARAEST